MYVSRRRRLLLHHALQRELAAADDARRRRRRRSCKGMYRFAAAPDLGAKAGAGPPRGIGLDPAAGPRGAGAARREVRRRGGGVQRAVVPAAPQRRARRRALEPAPPGPGAAGSLRLDGPRAATAARSWPRRTGSEALPEMVARWLPSSFTPLGTDGFGRSDTREALRSFFEIDAADHRGGRAEWPGAGRRARPEDSGQGHPGARDRPRQGGSARPLTRRPPRAPEESP